MLAFFLSMLKILKIAKKQLRIPSVSVQTFVKFSFFLSFRNSDFNLKKNLERDSESSRDEFAQVVHVFLSFIAAILIFVWSWLLS